MSSVRSVTAEASLASRRHEAKILSSGPRDPCIKVMKGSFLVRMVFLAFLIREFETKQDLTPGRDGAAWLAADHEGFE